MKKRAITAEDLYKMKFTGSPALSPDGRSVVYVVTEVSKEENGYSSSLFISDLDGEPRPLTHPYGEENLIRDTKPKWSPTGDAIAFLSNRNEKPQVWLLPINGGEARPVTAAEEGVDDFNWSPDGTRIVFTAKEKPDDKEENEDVIVITRLRYKGNGEGYRDGYSQIWVTDLESRETAKLTSGPYDYQSPSFTPSGEQILYLASKNEDHELTNLNDLYLYDLKNKVEKEIHKGKGPIMNPCLSPDGKWIAFAGHDQGEISSTNPTLWTLPIDGGEARNLTAELDRPVGNYVGVDASYDQSGRPLKWAADGQSILFMVTFGGDCFVKSVSLDGDIEDAVVYGTSVITSFDEANGTLAFVKATPHSTGDLFLKSDGNTAQLSNHNAELFSEISLSTPDSFIYKGADGWDIEGWILPPTDTTGEKVPVVVEIHGGPHTSYGNALHHEFQLLAARGYAVVYTNPRGSHGYGNEFVKACVGDWGNKDREDIMLGLDYVLDHYDYCDPNQLYVTGGSYGGIMTNYIVTQTDRFRAAVTQRCISNMYSFFGTSDIGFYFGAHQLGDADQWENEEKIMQFSPIRNARNVKTPTCIIHSEEDYRCPMEQAEQWYVALTRLGVDTKFIRFKGENHELSRSGKPKNRIRRLEEIIGWFKQH